ncbi:unnamed protein product [Ascophyllum nodosum]
MILNPCSIPSRMVVNQIMENKLGDICSRLMTFADATMYKKFDEEGLDELAVKLGISIDGLHTVYNGTDGRRVKTMICMAYNGYQRLDKLAKDGSAVTNVPNINTTTQQPNKSIVKGGGQKSSYMEIDTLVAHGCGDVTQGILMEDSDAKTYYTCDQCGRIAGVNSKKGIYQCNSCEGATFTKSKTTHATNIIMNNMALLGSKVTPIHSKPMQI